MQNPKAIPLNSGLDTVTPAILQEGGALLSCLNYEMTGTAGYRRIDGYERFDGWVNGDIGTYYRVAVTINDGSVTASIVPGAVLTAVDSVSGASIRVGVVVDYSGGNITYVSINPDYVIIPNGTGLDTTETTTTRITANAAAVNGAVADSANAFVTNIRAYSTVLRGQVSAMATNVAGVYWFRNRPVAALDSPVLRYTDGGGQTGLILEGSLIAYNGTTYRVVNRNISGSTLTLSLEPVATNGFTPANVYVVYNGGATTQITAPNSLTLTTGSSDWAYLVALGNPETGLKGTTLLKRSYILGFSNAVAGASTAFVRDGVVAIGTGGTSYNNSYVNNAVVTSGTYAAGTAAGYIEVLMDAEGLGSSGSDNTITTVMDILGFNGGAKLADITYVSLSKIAGTRRLRTRSSRYQWETYNFYGQEDTTRFYGATGASRAFWGNAYVSPLTSPPPAGSVSSSASVIYAWGNILTNLTAPDSTAAPKYLTMHSHAQLALGFRGGSVLLSVIGEPLNFAGAQGAIEVATGDDITGLVPGANDSTIVFTRRSVRRITGSTDADLAMQTIAANAGAFDYTCMVVGGSPVFTNNAGITSLEQTAAYGDFQGLRTTYRVSNTLPLELVSDRSDSEAGGVAMALTVRSKDQYRLWLKSGKVVTVSFTGDGPKIMESNYGAKFVGNRDIRVPFAWASETADSGKEMIFVVWDDQLSRLMENVTGNQGSVIPNPKQIYALERGWGFDGVRFPHNFDIAHIFERAGSQYTSVSKVRAYGKGYGLSTLNIKAAGIEGDFDVAYHSKIQDLSLPRTLELFTPAMRNVTNIVDSANRGLGIKLGIYGTELTPTQTEPSHIIQVLVCDIAEGGQSDG